MRRYMGAKTKRGIYAVVHKNTGKIEYVGKSDKSIDDRQLDHQDSGRYHPGIEKMVRIHVTGEERRANVEARLIRALNPPRNRKEEPIRGGAAERIGSWLETRGVIKKLKE